MTGFGEATLERDGSYVEVEISSLNRRYSNIKVNVEDHPALERKIVSFVKEKIERGSIEIKVESNLLGQEKEPRIDSDMLRKYLETIDKNIGEEHFNVTKITAGELLNLPGVLEIKKVYRDSEKSNRMIFDAVKEAVAELIKMREVEGGALRQDLRKHKNDIDAYLKQIEDRVPAALEKYRSRILESVEAFLELPEDELSQRLEDELKVYADKCDISEEISRMKSHIKQFDNYLEKDGPVGKSIEFLLQELQREINTIGAKANDAYISQVAVDIKSELEKCREQVKNVE
jgi:uncharacterized protein (TIGR00255 family)